MTLNIARSLCDN